MVNVAGGDVDEWTGIEVDEWSGNDIDGITCLGQWGGAVSNGQAEVLHSRDRFVTRVSYTTADLTAHPPNDIDAASQSFIVVAADDGYIYVSRDGLTTCPTSLEGTITTENLTGVEIAPSNRQVVYAWTSADDIILKTENGGETWFQVATTGTGGTGITALKVHHDNANLVLAATDAGEVFQSTDGGETWTEQADLIGMSTKANVAINDIDTVGGGVWFLAGTESGEFDRVYVNYEDGAGGAWEYFNPLDSETYATTVEIKAIAAADPNRLVAVGGNDSDTLLVALLS